MDVLLAEQRAEEVGRDRALRRPVRPHEVDERGQQLGPLAGAEGAHHAPVDPPHQALQAGAVEVVDLLALDVAPGDLREVAIRPEGPRAAEREGGGDGAGLALEGVGRQRLGRSDEVGDGEAGGLLNGRRPHVGRHADGVADGLAPRLGRLADPVAIGVDPRGGGEGGGLGGPRIEAGMEEPGDRRGQEVDVGPGAGPVGREVAEEAAGEGLGRGVEGGVGHGGVGGRRGQATLRGARLGDRARSVPEAGRPFVSASRTCCPCLIYLR